MALSQTDSIQLLAYGRDDARFSEPASHDVPVAGAELQALLGLAHDRMAWSTKTPLTDAQVERLRAAAVPQLDPERYTYVLVMPDRQWF